MFLTRSKQLSCQYSTTAWCFYVETLHGQAYPHAQAERGARTVSIARVKNRELRLSAQARRLTHGASKYRGKIGLGLCRPGAAQGRPGPLRTPDVLNCDKDHPL